MLKAHLGANGVQHAFYRGVENSFERLERFTSDVSHELRTPLAAMRSVGEVGLQEDHDTSKYRDIIGSMLEEVGRLAAMVDTLLTIAHADSGARYRKISPPSKPD